MKTKKGDDRSSARQINIEIQTEKFRTQQCKPHANSHNSWNNLK